MVLIIVVFLIEKTVQKSFHRILYFWYQGNGSQVRDLVNFSEVTLQRSAVRQVA